MNASNDKPKIVKWWSKPLFRLGVTLVAIGSTVLYLKLHPNSSMPYATFQNAWLTCAYIITTVITGILFPCVVYYSSSKKVRKKAIYAYFAFIIFFIITAISIHKIHSPCKVLIFLPVVPASIVFFVDFQLAKAGLKRLRIVYRSFDLGVLAGVSSVAVLTTIFRNEPPELIYGFGGGASAFQLIMANIVFDPSNYIEEEKQEHVKN